MAAAWRAVMKSEEFRAAAIGLAIALSFGVFFMVMSFVLPVSRRCQIKIWQCAVLAFFATGVHVYRRSIIWYPLAVLILRLKHKPKPHAA
ncbi:hypothetical protein E2562_001640 [Oryza meyeriana var. granulata]|uniref:Uncharacterized protein n=1 Tax=Oryza meyeriana var. granulata TaxID=110450 RepID=A0A6G1CD20_9ORYZ|nr:hypothetical protein E2562_001640 [Oryza meyeriana var. granulata]